MATILSSINPGQPAISSSSSLTGSSSNAQRSSSISGSSFANELSQAVVGLDANTSPQLLQGSSASAAQSITEKFGMAFQEVNDTVVFAENKMERLATGEEKDIHGTMIAMEKASISFKMMSAVRNKIISAYQEISRMQV